MQGEGKGAEMTAARQQQAEVLGTVPPCSTQRIITLLSPLYSQHPKGHAEKYLWDPNIPIPLLLSSISSGGITGASLT